MQAYAEGSSTTATLSVSVVDAVMYSFVAVFIIVVAILSHTQIKTSRRLEDLSDEAMRAERLRFERRIAERTAAFVRSEEQRMIELKRNATFGELSKGLFHDLMNPLAALTAYAEDMARKNTTSNTGKDMIDKMLTTSRKLGSYIDSVRRCLDTDKVRPVDTSDLWHEAEIVRDVLGYKARMAHVNIVLDVHAPLNVHIHPVRLHQLLLNLVTNGIDACVERGDTETSERDMSVTIRAEQDADRIRISIQDTGVGMSKAIQGKLFKESFTTKAQGTGIGLSTVKLIVEEDLEGTIAVESQEGVGSTFTITFSRS